MSETTGSETASAPREELLDAVAEIRREAAKAAAVHAALDAMVVFAVLRLSLQLLSVGDGAEPVAAVPVPDAVGGSLRGIGVAVPDPVGVSAASLVVAATAVSWLAADAAFRYERLGVERFEAHNPGVAEALRTARDAAASDVETPVATELYRTVLRRLEETSSRAFLRRRQLVGVVVALALCSAGIVGVAGAGIAPVDGGDVGAAAGASGGGEGGGGTGSGTGGGGTGGGASGSGGSADLLGEEGTVERGTDNRSVRLRGEGPDDGSGEYGDGSVAVDSSDVDASPAEFTDEQRPEAADLVRAYTERIREDETDD